MAEDAGTTQSASGSYIAQASDGGTANVNVYQMAAPQPIDEATLAAARDQLVTLPLDTVPAVAPLPPGSRMPFAHNPLFVGREANLLAIARTLKGGGTAALAPAWRASTPSSAAARRRKPPHHLALSATARRPTSTAGEARQRAVVREISARGGLLE